MLALVIGLLLIKSVILDTPNGEKFEFISKAWKKIAPPIPRAKYVYRSEALVINCTTNDPDAIVSLEYRESSNEPYVSVFKMAKLKDRIKRKEQNFLIPTLALRDTGMYQCAAANNKDPEVEMYLGRLYVRSAIPNLEPRLYPAGKEIAIPLQGDQNIVCSRQGKAGVQESFLNWKRVVQGKNVLVDRTKISREEETDSNGAVIDVEVLMFKNFSQADVGTYVCERKVDGNAPTSSSIDVKLAKSVAPSMVLDKTFVSEVEGIYLNVRCSIGGVPPPRKYWETSDGKMKGPECVNTVNPDCFLSFPKTSHPKDSGLYRCVGENSAGTVKKEFTLEVRVPPEIRKSAIQMAAVDEDIQVSCGIKVGNPKPTWKWEFQVVDCDASAVGKCEPDDSKWKSVTKQYPPTSTPTDISYIWTGKTRSRQYYRCTAVSAKDKDDNHAFAVQRSEGAPAQYAMLPKSSKTGSYSLNEQDKLEVQCLMDVNTYTDVKLTKDGSLLSTDALVIDQIKYQRYKVDKATLQDSGQYKCDGILKSDGSTRNKILNVTVKALTSPTIKAFSNRTVTQDVTRNIKITCDTDGNPPPSYSWNFNGTKLDGNVAITNIERCNYSTPGIYSVSGMPNTIVICKLDYKLHEGKYECVAINGIGVAKESLNLEVKAKPQMRDWTPEVALFVSDTKELTCVVDANPVANVTWLKRDPITNATTVLSSRMGAEIWILGRVQKSDAGEYICVAYNNLGKISKSMVVLVKDKGALVSQSAKSTIIGVVVPVVIIFIIALLLLLWYRQRLKVRYARYLEPKVDFSIDPDRSLFDQSSELPYDMGWEFPRERVNKIKTIGSGAFGQVWLAEAEGINAFLPRDTSPEAMKRRRSMAKQRRRYHSISVRYNKKQLLTEETTLEKTLVAVKTLKDDAAEGEYKDLASELKILIHLGSHKNIVNLLGACTIKGPLMVILECCPHGSLLTFLRNKREMFQPVWTKYETDMSKEFTFIDLLMISIQAARGMHFLQSKKCVHRDLAARNVLVGEDYIMKIADFGLARDIYKDEFYLKQTTGLLPIKWMAPECLFDKVYTPMSDVWSYGILLWEIYTLGGSPYPGLPTEDLFEYLKDGHRMARPEICPPEIYEIMMDCWQRSPFDRPMFAQIGDRLSNLMKQNVPVVDNGYLDFTDAGDDYLQPQSDEKTKQADSNDYLEATDQKMDDGDLYLAPQKNGGYPDESDALIPTEGYVPMTPADHYQAPSFRYDDDNPKGALV